MTNKKIDINKTKEKSEPGLHKKIVQLMKDKIRYSVLDIATGEGHLAGMVHNKGFNVICNDIDKENFKFRSELKFFNYDLNKLNEKEIEKIINENKNKKFDCILAIEIIEHIENPYKLIRDCHSMLVEEGTLIISTPNITETRSRMMFLLTGRFLSFFPGDKEVSGHINPIPLWELKDILENNGFRINSIDTHIHSFFGSFYSLKSILSYIVFFISIILSPFVRTVGFSKKSRYGHVIIIEAKKESKE